MDRDRYFVVLHKGEWKVKHNGRHSHPYETQTDAIRSAIDATHAAHREGGLSQVLVQGQDLLFRAEWTYGKDPYPHPVESVPQQQSLAKQRLGGNRCH